MLKKLLVADDSRTIREMVTLALGNGVDYYEVEDGNNVLDNARKYQPDVILLDLFIQGLDGYEVCKALKEDEMTKGIPVVFLAGIHRVYSEEECLKCGGDEIVTKPFSVKALRLVMDKVAQQAPAGRYEDETFRLLQSPEEDAALNSGNLAENASDYEVEAFDSAESEFEPAQAEALDDRTIVSTEDSGEEYAFPAGENASGAATEQDDYVWGGDEDSADDDEYQDHQVKSAEPSPVSDFISSHGLTRAFTPLPKVAIKTTAEDLPPEQKDGDTSIGADDDVDVFESSRPDSVEDPADDDSDDNLNVFEETSEPASLAEEDDDVNVFEAGPLTAPDADVNVFDADDAAGSDDRAEEEGIEIPLDSLDGDAAHDEIGAHDGYVDPFTTDSSSSPPDLSPADEDDDGEETPIPLPDDYVEPDSLNDGDVDPFGAGDSSRVTTAEIDTGLDPFGNETDDVQVAEGLNNIPTVDDMDLSDADFGDMDDIEDIDRIEEISEIGVTEEIHIDKLPFQEKMAYQQAVEMDRANLLNASLGHPSTSRSGQSGPIELPSAALSAKSEESLIVAINQTVATTLEKAMATQLQKMDERIEAVVATRLDQRLPAIADRLIERAGILLEKAMNARLEGMTQMALGRVTASLEAKIDESVRAYFGQTFEVINLKLPTLMEHTLTDQAEKMFDRIHEDLGFIQELPTRLETEWKDELHRGFANLFASIDPEKFEKKVINIVVEILKQAAVKAVPNIAQKIIMAEVEKMKQELEKEKY